MCVLLDAADVAEQHVQDHHASLHIAGFYPSLHANYRRLGSFDAAREHPEAARERSSALAPDSSAEELLRPEIDKVTTAVENRDTAVLPSAPAATA